MSQPSGAQEQSFARPAREGPRVIADIEDQVRQASRVVVQGSGCNSCSLPEVPRDVVGVRVPSGILRIDAGEMIVECLAGTPVHELQSELAVFGQRVNCDPVGTVGGNLAASRNSIHRLGRGALRDAVLRLDVVGADGVAYRCGGDTVKNVSGFDLCRLHVGAYGTLGILVVVVLRTFPLPRASRWMRTSHESAVDLVSHQWGVTSALSDGTSAFVHCEGHERDLETIATTLRAAPVNDAPQLGSFRWSVPPSALPKYVSPGTFGEIGVGVVHAHHSRPGRSVSPQVRLLNERVRDLFDPDRRLNPHIEPMTVER